MGLLVVNKTLTFNTLATSAATAATSTTADEAQLFDIVPTTKAGIIKIVNASGANGTVTFSLAVGTHGGKASAALTGSVAQGVTSYLQVDSGKYANDDGEFALTITPASGKKLLTDHALTVEYIQAAL